MQSLYELLKSAKIESLSAKFSTFFFLSVTIEQIYRVYTLSPAIARACMLAAHPTVQNHVYIVYGAVPCMHARLAITIHAYHLH